MYSTEHYGQDWDAAGLPAGSYYYLLQEPTTQRKVVDWVDVVR